MEKVRSGHTASDRHRQNWSNAAHMMSDGRHQMKPLFFGIRVYWNSLLSHFTGPKQNISWLNNSLACCLGVPRASESTKGLSTKSLLKLRRAVKAI